MRTRDVFVATLVVLLTVGTVYILFQLSHLLVVMFFAMIFASTVRPILKMLTRWRVPQWAAIGLIYTTAIAAVILLIVVALPPIFSLLLDIFQGNEFTDELSYELVRFGFILQRQFEVYIPIMQLPEQFRSLTEMADQTLREQAVPLASNAFYIMGQFLIAIVISIYWLTTRRTALRSLLKATPSGYQKTISHIWIDTEEMLGGYFRGQIILALIVGVASLVGLLVLRVPHAPALAVLAGLMEFVPLAGPIIAAIPAVIMGLTVSPVIALLIGIWYLVVQQVEANFLIPKIMGNSVSLNPLVVLLAIIAGVQLNGILGALLAIPLVGVGQVVLRHMAAASLEKEQAAEAKAAAAAEKESSSGAGTANDVENAPRSDKSSAPPPVPAKT